MAPVKDWRAVLGRVKSALMRRGCTIDDAEDLAQEAYLKFYCYELEHSVDSPDAFVMRAALNLAIDAHRVRRNHGESVLLEEMTLAELLRADRTPTAEATLLAKERLARLADALFDVDAKTRAIFLAHRLDGMTCQEIARLHQISVSAVEKRVAKATVAVMQRMEGW